VYGTLTTSGIPMQLVRLIKRIYVTSTAKRASKCLISFLRLKQRHILSPPLFNFPLNYTITKVQKNEEGLTPNGLHHLLAYGDVNLFGKNKNNTTAKSN
jgi:hypothetical protein